MSKKLASVLVGGLFASMVSLGAQALPLSPAPAGVANPDLTLVAGGCGPGWHRNPYGACVPNRYYAPYYPPRACPPGFWLTRWGRCVPY